MYIVVVNILSVTAETFRILRMTHYINNIHGNTMQVDKFKGLHILGLHVFTAGITSSIFIAGFLTFCAAYVAFIMGVRRMLRCCCWCVGQAGDQLGGPLGSWWGNGPDGAELRGCADDPTTCGTDDACSSE